MYVIRMVVMFFRIVKYFLRVYFFRSYPKGLRCVWDEVGAGER